MTTQMILMVVILLAVTYMFFSPRFPNAVVATIGAVVWWGLLARCSSNPSLHITQAPLSS